MKPRGLDVTFDEAPMVPVVTHSFLTHSVAAARLVSVAGRSSRLKGL